MQIIIISNTLESFPLIKQIDIDLTKRRIHLDSKAFEIPNLHVRKKFQKYMIMARAKLDMNVACSACSAQLLITKNSLTRQIPSFDFHQMSRLRYEDAS